ncbi:MAG: hypothetical protein AABY32_07200 [Nanoarchaeota archaeon]
MEKPLYYAVMEDMIKSRRTHSRIINSIDNIREKQSDNAYSPVEAGREIPFLLYKEYKREIENLEGLNEFDAALDFNIINYKFPDFVRVLSN